MNAPIWKINRLKALQEMAAGAAAACEANAGCPSCPSEPRVASRVHTQADLLDWLEPLFTLGGRASHTLVATHTRTVMEGHPKNRQTFSRLTCVSK